MRRNTNRARHKTNLTVQCAHIHSVCKGTKTWINELIFGPSINHSKSFCFRCSHCCDCRRPSISGNWKTNSNQIVVEEVPVLDRYKLWIDQVCDLLPNIHSFIKYILMQVSQMFGGLSICSLEAVVGN